MNKTSPLQMQAPRKTDTSNRFDWMDGLDVNGELIAKNIRIGRHRTSIRLEAKMWASLDKILIDENVDRSCLFEQIALRKNPDAAFTAALRSFILSYYKRRGGAED